MMSMSVSAVRLRVNATSLLCLLCGLFGTAVAQEPHLLWVYVKTNPSPSLQLDPSSLGITERALWRRAKVLPSDRLVDEFDLPVSEQVLSRIEATGARIRTVSRWLRAVSIEASPQQAAAVTSLPDVRSVDPVAVYRRNKFLPETVQMLPGLDRRSSVTGLDYGSSFTQLNLINVIPLHDAGINGQGIIVGMVDDGYNNHRIHEATAGNRVLAEYDFIQGDTNTTIEAGDYPGQGNHGMYTYSALSGFSPGALIGPAYGSSFLLAKTEVIGSETQIEEDLYVQGLEWLERLGADLVSSSLGYIDWYTYADLDGNTAVTTKAARIATRKGVLLVTAMGNESWYQLGQPGVTGTMIAPADADSVISVGAITSTSTLASFSSTGPTADGRIKPEVVALGVSVACASPVSVNGYVAVNGTSLSTPLTAGAAALVLSAHPNLTPAEVRDAFMATAVPIDDGTSKTSVYPNNFYGYGRVNALLAALYHGPAFSNRPTVIDQGTTLEIVTSVLSTTTLDPDSLCVYYRLRPGEPFGRTLLSPGPVSGQYRAVIPKGSGSTYPQGYFSLYSVGFGSQTHPFNAPESLFVFWDSPDTGTGGGTVATFVLQENYPNPFNAGTTISFDAPSDAYAEISIYTLLGQRVVTVFRAQATQGRNIVYWDGRDATGAHVPSGVYFYQLSTSEGVQSRKLMVLR